ncbi:MAG TPA: S9 family peptidase, partial [Acidimicrobiales bacterium]|nr:S9 family peptidase [Acidimicrobiales bacterium]
PTATLRRLHDDGAPALHTFFNRPDPRVARLALTPPRLTTHGDIQVALYEPTTEPPWPTVTWVYGGPHVQLVANAWGLTAAMRAQYLRSRGYLVVVADNRGSARRGLAFEGAVKHRLGHVEVDDQVAVIDDLVDQGLADPANVGVYGWSYGGYMAAMLLARAPATYKVAVAGAPVTSWDGYDTHYTERYLGTPQDNADGYDASAVFPYTADIAGDLLLVHGMLDENVHFRHTARLVTRLIRDRKRYELLVFPDERHGPRRFEDRVYLEEAVTEFLTDRLSP